MLSENEQAASSWECQMSVPNFTGDDYELNISAALPTKLDSMALLVTIVDTDSQEQIMSESYTYKSVKSINEKMILSIPDDNQNLLAQLSFVWNGDKGQQKKTFTKNYKVVGNSAVLVQHELIHPVSRTSRPAIQIVNGTSSMTADYNYPLNAMYISQEENNQLDLYTPIDLQMKLAEGFKLLDYSGLHITLTPPSGQAFRYCNNSKFVSFKTDPDTGLLHLKVIEEWKNHISTKDYSASIAKMKLAIQITLEVSSELEEGYRNITVDTGKEDRLITAIEYLWNL